MRARDTTRWGIGLLYPNQDCFLQEPVGDGLHVVQFGHQTVDLLIRDRGSDATVVVFHASITNRTTYPVLAGERFTEEANVNLVSVSDPGISLSNKHKLGWFIGTRQLGVFKKVGSPLIRHAIENLNTSRTILWGSSGGVRGNPLRR